MHKQIISHVSFDLDGTLVDSIPIMRTAWKETMLTFGLTIPFSSYAKLIGLPFPDIMRSLDLTDFLPDIQLVYFNNSKKYADQIAVLDGAYEVLQKLIKMNMSTSIITSKPRLAAEPLLARLNIVIDNLICGDDYTLGKPYIEPGKNLLTKIETPACQLLYVGDMIYDLQFAQNCGFQFIYYTNGGRNSLPNNLKNKYTEVASLSDIIERIKHVNDA